jgi:hypothetical protein
MTPPAAMQIGAKRNESGTKGRKIGPVNALLAVCLQYWVSY